MSKITTDFIKSIRKMYEEVSALLTEIKVVQRDVQTIKERVIEDSDKERTNDQARDAQDDASAITTANTAQAEGEEEEAEQERQGLLSNQWDRWKNQLAEPKFQVSLLTLAFLFLYTCETKRTNDITQKTLEINRDLASAQIIMDDWDFVSAVTPKQRIGIKTPFTNKGHSPTIWGINTVIFRWAEMPANIPITAPEPSQFMEPDKPTPQITFDTEIASEEFIYSIPHISEVRGNLATRHLEPPLPRPTLFIIGRLVYDSLGIRTERQFCSFMIYGDDLAKVVDTPKTDPRFIFIGCPKWNTTTRTAIK